MTTEKRINWLAYILGTVFTLLGSGATWMVNAVVHGEQTQVVQSRDIAAHSRQIERQDHELLELQKIVVRLDANVTELKDTQKRTAAVLERLEQRVNEMPHRGRR